MVSLFNSVYHRVNVQLGCVLILFAHSKSKFSNKSFPLFTSWKILFLLLSFTILAPISPVSSSDTASIAQLKASFIYNFARHVEWPANNSKDFRIAVVGEIEDDLRSALTLLQESKTLLNKPIRVAEENNISQLKQYDLIYLSESSTTPLDNIIPQIDGSPILLVSFEQTNKRLVMLNLIKSEKNTLKFELNKANLINQGLFPKSDLILLGGTEIDVAKLYREGRQSLMAMQTQLQEKERSLSKLSTSIGKLQRKNNDMQGQLVELDKQLVDQRNALEQGESEKKALLSDISERQNELERKNSLLSDVAGEIVVKEMQLAELNSTIKQQDGEISSLDSLVDAQKLILRYLWATIALGVLLVVAIFIGYIMKRRDNKKLKERSQDLKMARDRLALAKSKAESANEAKSQFLSLMSHELRTPLQSVIGYTEVVKEELNSQGDERYIDDLNRVINNSDRLLKLINNVLDLAKAESGEMKVHISEVKLSTLTQEALDNVRPQIEKNNNSVTIDVDNGNPLPKSDPEKILHILVNLLSNATKFTENGNITVSVRKQEKVISIRVQDEGIGLSDSQINTIFERFKQVDSSSTRKFQGSGLGLSIVKQFVDQLGGDINVTSELGKGARFEVIIPLAPGNASSSEQNKKTLAS